MRYVILFSTLMPAAGLLLLMLNCGGSSNSAGNSCGSLTYSVVGNWTLSVWSNGAPVGVGPGVINSSGTATFFQTTNTMPAPGDTVVMPFIIQNSVCIAGTATVYATPASGGGSTSETVQGRINSASNITGTLANGNQFLLSGVSPLSGSATALSGSGYWGEAEGQNASYIWQLTFTPTGTAQSMTFSGSNGEGCSLTGQFNQESTTSSVNVFDMAMSFSGTNCPATNLTGAAFESNADYFGMNANNPGIYLYSAAYGTAFVMEIFKP